MFVAANTLAYPHKTSMFATATAPIAPYETQMLVATNALASPYKASMFAPVSLYESSLHVAPTPYASW